MMGQAMKWMALLLGATGSGWLIGCAGGGWNSGTLGYVAWALMPYAGLLLGSLATLRWPAHASVERALKWVIVLLALLGPAMYIDILFVHVDAQGAIAMLVVPVIQTGLGLVATLLMAIWQWRISRRAAQSVPLGLAVATASTGATISRTKWKKPLRSVLLATAILGTLGYLGISYLQYQDGRTIDTAKEVDFYITEYCRSHQQLPSAAQLRTRFPSLSKANGWFYFRTDDDTNWLKVQYPVRWWNRQAIGRPNISEFTATAYAYSLEYHCPSTP